MSKHRVVILGGGFGGLYCAQALRRADIEITLVDKRNFHLFQPLLYQVATGALSPGEIATPIRTILSKQKNVRVLLDEAVDVDTAAKKLILKGCEVEYDTLIVSTGSRTSYFGNDTWERQAPGLKTIEEATRIRHKILYAYEAAERTTDPVERNAWLTFIVVGGGPTGVELAGAMGEIANLTLKHEFDHIRPEESRILLLDGGERLLAAYPPELSQAAEQFLIKLGVRSRNKVRVIGVDEKGVTIRTAAGEDHIRAHTVIWAAGVTSSEFGKVLATRTGVALDKAGRVMVEKDLSVPGNPNIFVIGDLANFSYQTGSPLPGVAPVAMQQGKYVANLVRKRLKNETVEPFSYWDKGSLAVIGRAAAIAYFEKVGKLKVKGLIAWLLWLFIHLMYIVEFENRLLIFMRWGLSYLFFFRGARLITGDGTSDYSETRSN